ncbi:hypothetical protein Tco_0944222 [Tanacetum coccineum]
MLTSKWTTFEPSKSKKFNAIYKRCHRLKKSGESEVDLMGQARGMYQDEDKNAPFNHDKLDYIATTRKNGTAHRSCAVDLIPKTTGDFHASVNTESYFGADPDLGRPQTTPRKKTNPTHREHRGSNIRPNSVSLCVLTARSNEAAENAFKASKDKDETIKSLESSDFPALEATKDLSDDDAVSEDRNVGRSQASVSLRYLRNRTTKTTPTSSFF